MSSHVQVRIPGASNDDSFIKVNVKGDVQKDISHSLGLSANDKRRTIVVASGRESRLFSPGDLEALQNPDNVLEVWVEPQEIDIEISSTNETHQNVLLDFGVDLGRMLTTIQRRFQQSLGVGGAEFVISVLDGKGERFLTTNASLTDQHVRVTGAPPHMRLRLHFTRDLCSQAVVSLQGPPELDAVLAVQSRKLDRQKLSSRKQVYFVLRGAMLYMHRSRNDPLPNECIPLQYFMAIVIQPKGKPALVLKRYCKAFGDSEIDFYLLHGETDQQVDQWYRSLRQRCVSGTKSFGVPLATVLDRQQRKPPIPKVVEQLITWLDARASAGGGSPGPLYMRHPKGAAALPAELRGRVSLLRDHFDAGVPVELGQACGTVPIVAAELLKLYFAELPEPVLGADNYAAFVGCVADGGGPADWTARLFDQVAQLPLDNFILLKYLCTHLNNAVEVARNHRPSVAELAAVFAVSMLRPSQDGTDDEGTGQHGVPPAHRKHVRTVAELLIAEHQKLYVLRDGKKMRLEFKSKPLPASALGPMPRPGPGPGRGRPASSARPMSSPLSTASPPPSRPTSNALSTGAGGSRPNSSALSTSSSPSKGPGPAAAAATGAASAVSPALLHRRHPNVPSIKSPPVTPRDGGDRPPEQSPRNLISSPLASPRTQDTSAAANARFGHLSVPELIDQIQLQLDGLAQLASSGSAREALVTGKFLRSNLCAWFKRRKLPIPDEVEALQASPDDPEADQAACLVTAIKLLIDSCHEQLHSEIHKKLTFVVRTLNWVRATG